MIDPGTGLAVLGSAIGGAKIAEKILGPSAEYVGDQLKEWTQKKHENIARIFENANEKIGEKINDDGKVPPKVLKSILDDGAWCEEDLQVEYFGGVLASSRSGTSRDDRGAYYTSIITRLTTYQLRLHYLAYHIIKNVFNGEGHNIHELSSWEQLETFISEETFAVAMNFDENEENQRGELLAHSIWGLQQEGLLSEFRYGSQDHIKKVYQEAPSSGILIKPSKIGFDLFLWAYGKGDTDCNDFLSSKIEFPNNQDITILKGQRTKLQINGLPPI